MPFAVQTTTKALGRPLLEYPLLPSIQLVAAIVAEFFYLGCLFHSLNAATRVLQDSRVFVDCPKHHVAKTFAS